MKKDAKNKNPEEEKMKRYLGALNEMHGENLKGIREDSILVNKNLEDIKETLSEHSEILRSHSKILNSHTETLNSHSEILNLHSEILKSHSKTLDSHTEMIGTLMEDVSAIRSDLKKKVDYDEFLSLLKRVQKLETKFT